MERDKPDLAAYRHFLGSEVGGNNSPDTGTSAACSVAAGCVAASRPKHSQSDVTARRMASISESTARKPSGTAIGWDRKQGHSILNVLAVDRNLP